MPERTCCLDGCSRPASSASNAMCALHCERIYRARKRGVEPDLRPPPREARGPWRGCWEWTGDHDRKGYGRTTIGSLRDHRTFYVHRLVFEAIYGIDPGPLDVCHTCDNPPCWRPDHLFLGTRAENVADMVAKGRQARGSGVAGSVLTPDLVRTIRQAMAARSETARALAQRFGVTVWTIYDITERRRWAWLD